MQQQDLRKQALQSNALKTTHHLKNVATEQAIWIPKEIRKLSKQQKWFWVPKNATQQKSQKSGMQTTLEKPRRKKKKYWKHPTKAVNQGWVSQLKRRWVSKKMLQEQGYYEGATHLWLPKEAIDLKSLPKEANFFKTKAQTKTSSSRRPNGSQKIKTCSGE